MLAEGLLRDEEPICGPGDVKALGQFEKLIQASEIHGSPLNKFLCEENKTTLFDLCLPLYYNKEVKDASRAA